MMTLKIAPDSAQQIFLNDEVSHALDVILDAEAYQFEY